MMFGDMGHGSIILMVALFLCAFEHKLRNSSMKAILPFRYILLLMGLSSTYCGFIYNEFFALPMQIFSSCYNLDTRSLWMLAGGEKNNFYYSRKNFECNYPFGVDPVWSLATTRLNFTNSIKMKLSVIMGVLHMTIGVLIKGTNAIYFGRWPDLVTEVITGCIILLGLFGWMDLLIFAKWFFNKDFLNQTIITSDYTINNFK